MPSVFSRRVFRTELDSATAAARATDVLTTSMLTKLQLCMLCSVIGQGINAVCYSALLLRLDWDKAARVIAARANTDRRQRLVTSDAQHEAAGVSEVEEPAEHSVQQHR